MYEKILKIQPELIYKGDKDEEEVSDNEYEESSLRKKLKGNMTEEENLSNNNANI